MLLQKPHHFTKGTGYERAKLILGEGLLTSSGTLHDKNRLIVQPAFHKQMVDNMISIISKNVNRMLRKWESTAKDYIEAGSESADLFLRIICEAVFSGDADEELISHGITFNNVFNNYGLFLLAFPGFTSRLPLPAVMKFKQTKKIFDEKIYSIISKRRNEKTSKKDVLSMLINSTYEDGSAMTDTQIRDEIVTLFFAAHDTSAKTLTWTLYLLSQNPDYFNLIKREAESISDGGFTYENIRVLKLCRASISESLRLFPPAHSISRIASKNTSIGGYPVSKGSSVLIMPYIIHRDEKNYSRPSEFIPERWEQHERKSRHKLSFIPFGAGARGCLGEAFAWTQLTISLAFICSRFSLMLHPSQKVAASSSITLRPKYGMKMILQPA